MAPKRHGTEGRGNRRVVLLHGPEGVGKTTTAKAWRSSGKAIEIMSFAQPLKECLSSLTGLPTWKMMDPVEKETPQRELFGKTPRFVLRKLGTVLRENTKEIFGIDEPLFGALAAKRVEASEDDIVFDDCRYPDEVRQTQGTLILLEREGKRFSNEHSSDVALIDVDVMVNMDGKSPTEVAAAIESCVFGQTA